MHFICWFYHFIITIINFSDNANAIKCYSCGYPGQDNCNDEFKSTGITIEDNCASCMKAKGEASGVTGTFLLISFSSHRFDRRFLILGRFNRIKAVLDCGPFSIRAVLTGIPVCTLEQFVSSSIRSKIPNPIEGGRLIIFKSLTVQKVIQKSENHYWNTEIFFIDL